MDKKIDARGLQCPMPVIETKKALQGMQDGSLEIIVDNSIAVQNLIKMAKQKQLEVISEMVNEDYYVVRINVMVQTEQENKEGQKINGIESSDIERQRNESSINNKEANEKVSSNEICYPDSRVDNTVVVLSSNYMGSGDDKLGQVLMKGFIYALTELEQLPSKVLLYNGGAKLSVEGSDSLDDLKLLESQGVEILTCGTCLNFYEITDKLAVGTVTNMYAIAEILMETDKIIRP